MWQNKIRLYAVFCSLGLLFPGAAAAEEYIPDTLADPILPEAEIFPEGASRAKWIWSPEFPARFPQTTYFRYRFTLPDEPACVSFRFVVEKKAVFHLNGHKLTSARFVPQGQQNLQVKTLTDMAFHLKKGENLLAVEAESGTKIAGIIAAWDVTLKNGKHLYFGTGPDVKVSAAVKDGWNSDIRYPETGWKTARVLGDAWSLPWSREGETAKLLSLEDDLVRQTPRLEKALALPESLKREPEKIRAEIVYSGKTPGIRINGKVLPPFIMIHRETPLAAKEADLILKSYRKGVRFFDVLCRTDRAYVKPGVYDFTRLEQEIRRVLHLAPDGYVIINFRIHGMPGFLDRYPDEAVGYRSGNNTRLSTDDLFGIRPRRPSSASLKMREELKSMLVLLGKKVGSQPWGKRVAGVRVSYGVYSEWQMYGHRADMPDCGKAMHRAFRTYLTEKYGTDAALRAAWGDKNVTLKTAEGPSLAEFKAQKSFIINPAAGQTGRKFLDHYECMANNVADLLLFMGKCAKDAMPGRLVGAYYGYLLSHSYSPCGQNALLEKVLSSPYVDFLSQPYGYSPEMRAPGGNANFAFPAIFRRHGKLLVTEADIRTHLSWTWQEKKLRCNTPEETEAVTKRDIGNSLINGTGIQFLHFGGTYEYKNPNWFNTKHFLDPLGKGIEAWRGAFASPAEDTAETAFVLQPDDKIRHGMPDYRSGEYLTDMLYFIGWQRSALGGFPFDLLTLKDFLNSGRNYKAVIFLNLFTVTKKEREQLKKRLRKPGVTAVWTYAPGISDGERLSDGLMSDLTGITLRTDGTPGPLILQDKRGIAIGVRSRKVMISPRVHAEDPGAEVLAWYADTKKPGLVRKSLKEGGTSVFAAASLSDLRFTVPILEKAGVRIWCKPDKYRYGEPVVLLRADEKYLLLHTGREKKKFTVKLPEKYASGVDIFTGECIFREKDVFTVDPGGSRTWLLKLTK